MKSARDDAAAMRKSEVVRLREALLAAKRTHLIVEGDCWYSCPASGQSCNNEADSGSRNVTAELTSTMPPSTGRLPIRMSTKNEISSG
jgi:hypothetical protein